MEHVDIAVIGLGSIGSMALWQLSARGGPSVLGIEQFGRVHAEGAYPGESRLFRVAAKEGQLHTPALLRARELWRELGTAIGRDILLDVGALSIAPAGHPDLDATLSSIAQFDLPHEAFSADELRRRYPQFHIDDEDIGVLDVLGGGIRPETAVLAATDRALARGASAWYDTRVHAVEPASDGVRVRTDRGEVIAGHVVVTAGPWVTRLVPQVADLVTVRSYALTWMMPRHIELFAPDRFPGFLRDLGDVHAFGVPTLDGFSIKICPHLVFDDVDDVDDRPLALTRHQLRWVGEQAQRMIPDLVPEPARWSLHPDSQTQDKLPILDTVADGRVSVAAGMSGNGFKFAPVYGAALAELALDGDSAWRHPSFTLSEHARRKAATTS